MAVKDADLKERDAVEDAWDEEEEVQEIEIPDFRMVTFSLGGRDYGVDIMKVKEIAKFAQYTYVPNTPPYVRGVYNLRGEIISVVDLRRMFNLPFEETPGRPDTGLIVHVGDTLVGVVVDAIDRVVAVPSRRIQPPHPLFGDINVRFISGVVEHEERLYIVLDIERILGREEEESAPEESAPASEIGKEKASKAPKEKVPAPRRKEEQDLQFIKEGLAALAGFHVTALNEAWVEGRWEEWKQERAAQGKELQLQEEEDAREFLSPFFSPHTGEFWGEKYATRVAESLPKEVSPPYKVWNVGCGKGYETYSLAALLRNRYPGVLLTIWAQDVDLLSVSMAPNLVVNREEVPSWLHSFLVEGRNGYTFSQEIKDAIVFEYHDVLNANPFVGIDLIVARDVLSFLEPSAQLRVLEEWEEKLKPKGLVLAGAHEDISVYEGWKRVRDDLPLFQKSTVGTKE